MLLLVSCCTGAVEVLGVSCLLQKVCEGFLAIESEGHLDDANLGQSAIDARSGHFLNTYCHGFLEFPPAKPCLRLSLAFIRWTNATGGKVAGHLFSLARGEGADYDCTSADGPVPMWCPNQENPSPIPET